VRAGFYYPWFPETWTVGGSHVSYRPTLGYYDTSNASTVDAHVRAMEYGKFEVAIASWFGRGTHKEAERLPLLLDRTRALGSKLKWSIYYEAEAPRTRASRSCSRTSPTSSRATRGGPSSRA
jgi:hypothetical protein